MKKLSCFVLLVLFSFTLATAQYLPTAGILDEIRAADPTLPSGEAPAFSAPIPAGTIFEAFDQTFANICFLPHVKGLNAAVRLPDGAIWKKACGLATSLPFSTTLTADHLMGMGSITKSFVSTTLLLLYEEGLVDLDDSIGQYVGPYPNISGQATIRQLLSHRTGFNDYLNENPAMGTAMWAHPDSIWVTDSVLYNYILQPNFPLGADWSYSNTNYLLAGRIIETVTGHSWYEEVRTRILNPLGLTHTFAYPWEQPGQPFAHVYTDIDGTGQFKDVQGNGIPLEAFFSLGGSAGALISTPEDLVKFHQHLYSGALLQAATLDEMQTDYINLPGAGIKYGLGTISWTIPQGLENWGHNGSIIYQSTAAYYPSEQIAIAVQQNDSRLETGFSDINDVSNALLNTYLNYVPTGSSEPGRKENLLVYPNPASDALVVTLPASAIVQFPVQCHLSDLFGHVVAGFELQQTQCELPVNTIPAGVYLLQVGNYTEKLVIERRNN